VKNWGSWLIAAGTLTVVVCAGFAPAVSAQLSSQDKNCIATFNKSVRKVAKAHGQIISKCLKDFSRGKLISTTPEGCLLEDPTGSLQRAVLKETAKTTEKCSAGIPGFGATPIGDALLTTVVGQINLIHSTYAFNLDSAMLIAPAGAACQARVGAALMRCEDTRLKEFAKCVKIGLRSGAILDEPSLTAYCLGTGGSGQPDVFGNGKIALDCTSRITSEITARCGTTDLALAFPACGTSNPTDAANCLKRASACQLCLLTTEVDALSRDCDLFDDGNTANGSCGSECGDGVVQLTEGCDDGDTDAGDGCSASCTVEGGWNCSGEPSVCTPNCGDGNLDPGETCDDSDTASGDGCSNACTVESGFSCTGEPSVCTPNCGNGDVTSGEDCDDGDTNSGDGCSSSCDVEAGYNCSGEPSVCTFVCGNGTFQNGETCDDGDAGSGDGCSSVCTIEAGWLCSGQPSLCTPLCGDGLIRGSETCDDDDALSGDGCSTACLAEPGFACNGEPSNCIPVCGDGFIRGFETCDDVDSMSGDGCSGGFCLQEAGYTCTGQPSVCIFNCGDGNLDPQEECDDGDLMGGDGCAANCMPEPGYACGGQPSVCTPTCGNALLNVSEECDDANITNGDGCTASCQNESGYLCTVPGLACTPFDVFIDSPAHGIFTTASSIVITGHYTTLLPGQVSVTINGVPAGSVNEVLRTYSHTLPLSASAIFNPVKVTLTNTANGDDVHARIVVINGQSVADGAFSPQSVALRINDSGLDSVEPLVAELAGGQFDFGSLIPVGMVLADECFIEVIGCWGSARVSIANPPPSIGALTLALDSKVNVVFADIRVNNIRIDIDIDGSGLVPDCGLRLTANQMIITGDYAMSPKVGDESNIDVNLVGAASASFAGFNDDFTSGLCDAPIIGDIIGLFLPDIEDFAVDAITGFVNDPDGGGPQDSPIADGIESALEGISISGPIGEGVGLMFESPLFTVAEDNNGITFGSNSRFQVSVGSGPGQCIPPSGAPNFTASYSLTEAFPTFGPNTPVGNVPYGLGIAISSSGFNQLLRGQTECGLMRVSLTEIDLDGSGGSPPLAINAGLLSLIIPEFGQLAPTTVLRIEIAPTLAPIVTGNAGPGGELTELRLSHVSLKVIETGPETLWLGGALDARMGINLAFLPDGSGLSIGLSTPQPGNLTVAIIDNPLGANEAQVETVLPALVTPLIPDLAGALSGFPLPQFFGLAVDGLEVSRVGHFLSLYANLEPVP
jgi:cysteine-rich repeat protein